VLKPWARVVVTLWVLIVVSLLFASSVLMVLSLPRVATTAWVSLGRRWRTLGVNLDQGDVAAVGVRLPSVLAIVLPLSMRVGGRTHDVMSVTCIGEPHVDGRRLALCETKPGRG
jgi:hypothetical protein